MSSGLLPGAGRHVEDIAPTLCRSARTIARVFLKPVASSKCHWKQPLSSLVL
jgi:hypothetical protein